MKLPNGHLAIVEDDKLLDYVLDPQHPVGRHHAALFERLLGLTRANLEVLRDALLEAAAQQEVEPGKSSPYGQKFDMRFEMTGSRGAKTVLAVWLIEAGDDRPRLITCYVE